MVFSASQKKKIDALLRRFVKCCFTRRLWDFNCLLHEADSQLFTRIKASWSGWRFPSEMTYIVSGGSLNSSALNIHHLLTHSLTHSINQSHFSDFLINCKVNNTLQNCRLGSTERWQFNSWKRKSTYFRFRCRLWKYQPVSALWLNIVGLQMAMDECSAIETYTRTLMVKFAVGADSNFT